MYLHSSFSICFAAVLAAILHSCTLSKDEPGDFFFSCYSSITVNTPPHGASFFSNDDPCRVFIYNDDGNALLDCYQDASLNGSALQVSSTSGRKKAVVVHGFNTGRLEYTDFASYEGLCGVCSSIFDEKVGSGDGDGDGDAGTGIDEKEQGIVRCGMCSFEAGPKKNYALELSPLLCRVRLESLEVDFSGRPYRDKKLENMKVYLTNVRALCPLVDSDVLSPQEILNYAGWDETLPSRMKNVSLIRSETVHNGLDLYCYPHNAGPEGQLGAPPTRLVIEGVLDGHTVYYPITIADGVMERGKCYSYRIVLTRSGGPDPDSPVETGTVSFQCKVKPWTEKENRYEEY